MCSKTVNGETPISYSQNVTLPVSVSGNDSLPTLSPSLHHILPRRQPSSSILSATVYQHFNLGSLRRGQVHDTTPLQSLEANRATLNLRHLNIIPLLFESATGIVGLSCVPLLKKQCIR